MKKSYGIVLNSEFTLDNGEKVKAGTMLHTQKKSYTIEQVSEALTKGYPYQWGFGPCYDRIKDVTFVKIEPITFS